MKEMNPSSCVHIGAAAVLSCVNRWRPLKMTSKCPRAHIANVTTHLLSGFGHVTFAMKIPESTLTSISVGGCLTAEDKMADNRMF